MATNATFNWIPQSGIVAQEVWYGMLSAVGSTYPPAAGWNSIPGNLLTPTTASVTINNLNENTTYQLAVRSYCTNGESNWAILPGYKLVCPTVTLTPHTASVDVALGVLFPTQLASVITELILSITDVTSGNILESISFSGAGIMATIYNTFTGLAASSPYIITLSYLLPTGTTPIICQTKAFNSSTLTPCTALTFAITNVTATGFTIVPSALSSGDRYDISLDGGSTYPYTGITTSSYPIIVAVGTYSVVVRRNCSAGGAGISNPQSVTVQAVVTGVLTLNSTINTINSFNTAPIYLVFSFSQPTPVPLTFLFGWTRYGGPTRSCKLSNGYNIFTVPSGAQSCTAFPTGSTAEGGSTPQNPFIVNIPSGVTSYNSGSIGCAGCTDARDPWQNSSQYTDIYMEISSPGNYNPSLVLQDGANIPAAGITLHNLT